jgi:uncharacterized protein with HEPN domain
MQRDPRAFLWDVREAALAIQSFTAEMDAALAARIADLPKIVAFRNQLIHGYLTVNVSTVWNVTQNALPPLIHSVQLLMSELGEPDLS